MLSTIRHSPASIPRLAPANTAGQVTQEEAAAMLRAVLKLFDRWDLRTDQRLVLMGGPSERTFQRWRSGQVAAIPNDTIYRMGDLLGIHKALRYMFTDGTRGYEWVKRPNAAFAEQTPLDVMLQGSPADVSRVRAYLDAERSGW